ncbi:hypothetical protein [Aromatoleum bremense]|uniref:DUF1998 domain-containing protein n=1 Tax=Aromatoleum bremense TaxID=76115 RepID=A0ABX1NZH9_9RHOO|nr:hypothetical protein [Aromatoleum bremense]NMG17473.1 hypothetical protein [Aromatoleum bremense]QTQ30070.1 Uncharacterized protein pbN1_00770 [Aromatoleum bremense]
MSENIEQELVQNSRIFYEAFLPGAVTRLRNQALAMVVGVADKEDALEGLDRTQLVDAVRKFLADWKIAGGSVDALVEEAAERNEFRVQAPSEIYVTPFPLVLRCQTCGALENHDKPRRQHEHTLATTYTRTSGGDGSSKAFIRCSEKGCGGRMQQVPFVVVHRCGHISAMNTPAAARGVNRLGLRHNNGMFRQNTFFDLASNDNVSAAYTEMCPTCSVSHQPDPSMLQKGTAVSGGDAFFPQVIQFVALSKKPGELVSSVQSELVRLPESTLSGRAKDLAEGVVYGLLGCIDSEALQAQLLQILEGGEVNADDLAKIQTERENLEKEIAMLDALIANGTPLESVRDASKERLSKLISKMGAAEGTFVDVRNYIDNDTVLLDLIRQRRTMEAVLLRHDVGRQGVAESIESTTDSVVKFSRSEDWKHVQSTYGIQDIAHIPDLKVVLTAVGFTREKREPERTQGEIPVKLNPFEDRIRSSAKGKAVLYAFSAQTEALWIRLDPIKVLQWCVKHAGWDAPPPEALQSRERAQAHLLALSPALTAAPGSATELTKTIGLSAAAPFHLMHTMSHSLMLTARRHSGYDSQSLTEYLLPMDLSFLIHVTSVQNYTAGGLLTLFQHYLRRWFEDASLHAFNCAFDPICSDVGSACPGCIQIPRGCETFNAGVSRSYLHGGYVDKTQSLWAPTGYWQS